MQFLIVFFNTEISYVLAKECCKIEKLKGENRRRMKGIKLTFRSKSFI